MEYPNLTITFLIEHDGRFLIIKRASNEPNFPSLWAFPGGKAEIGETAIDTIRREVAEETGLTLTGKAFFLDTYTFKKSVGIAFLVPVKSKDVVLSDEIEEYEWVGSLDELQKYKCIPGIYNHLERALAVLAHYDLEEMENLNLTKEKYINR